MARKGWCAIYLFPYVIVFPTVKEVASLDTTNNNPGFSVWVTVKREFFGILTTLLKKCRI